MRMIILSISKMCVALCYLMDLLTLILFLDVVDYTYSKWVSVGESETRMVGTPHIISSAAATP